MPDDDLDELAEDYLADHRTAAAPYDIDPMTLALLGTECRACQRSACLRIEIRAQGRWLVCGACGDQAST